MIFGIKVDVRINSRLVIEGHVVDSSGQEVYAYTMKSVSDRILMKIVAVYNLNVMTGDICNVYLNANTEENIYTYAGDEFDMVDIMTKGDLLEVVNELYGLPTSVNR